MFGGVTRESVQAAAIVLGHAVEALAAILARHRPALVPVGLAVVPGVAVNAEAGVFAGERNRTHSSIVMQPLRSPIHQPVQIVDAHTEDARIAQARDAGRAETARAQQYRPQQQEIRPDLRATVIAVVVHLAAHIYTTCDNYTCKSIRMEILDYARALKLTDRAPLARTRNASQCCGRQSDGLCVFGRRTRMRRQHIIGHLRLCEALRVQERAPLMMKCSVNIEHGGR